MSVIEPEPVEAVACPQCWSDAVQVQGLWSLAQAPDPPEIEAQLGGPPAAGTWRVVLGCDTCHQLAVSARFVPSPGRELQGARVFAQTVMTLLAEPDPSNADRSRWQVHQDRLTRACRAARQRAQAAGL